MDGIAHSIGFLLSCHKFPPVHWLETNSAHGNVIVTDSTSFSIRRELVDIGLMMPKLLLYF